MNYDKAIHWSSFCRSSVNIFMVKSAISSLICHSIAPDICPCSYLYKSQSVALYVLYFSTIKKIESTLIHLLGNYQRTFIWKRYPKWCMLKWLLFLWILGRNIFCRMRQNRMWLITVRASDKDLNTKKFQILFLRIFNTPLLLETRFAPCRDLISFLNP